MKHYKVIIQFTVSVRENDRYISKDYYDEFFYDRPNHFKVPRKKIFYDILKSYYGFQPNYVCRYRIEVIPL